MWGVCGGCWGPPDVFGGAQVRPPSVCILGLQCYRPLGALTERTSESVGKANYTSFAAQWTGFLGIIAAGTYTFFVTSNDGANLFIDGSLLVDDEWYNKNK